MLTPLARRVVSRIRCLNRSKAFGAIMRLISGPVLKLNPRSLPVKILSRVFRGKFLAGLKRLHSRNKLCCNGPAAALADPQQFAKLMRRLQVQLNKFVPGLRRP